MGTIHEQIEAVLGVPVGATWKDRRAFLAALEERGIRKSPRLVTGLRIGETSGEIILEQIRCAELLKQGTAAAKDSYYQTLIQNGLALRSYQKNEKTPHRFLSNNFTDAIAAEQATDTQTVRQCLRAMRADLVLSQPTTAVQGALYGAAAKFLNAYLLPASEASIAHKRLEANLQAEGEDVTIESFYRNLYGTMGPRSVGTWTPYEMDVLHVFYTERIAAGSPLSSFDRRVLNATIEGNGIEQEAVSIRAQTGIKMEMHVFPHHKNALLYGQPLQQS